MKTNPKRRGYFFIAISLLVLGFAKTAYSQSLEAEALLAHNKWRQLHRVPSLRWDKELQQVAQKHAAHCIFKHSSSGYGENLAAGYPSITAAVNAWYAESSLYSYKASNYSPETGHFTQLIWASSQYLGCASVSCNGKYGTPGIYWVCEYSPAGNILNPGYFKKNVLPL